MNPLIDNLKKSAKYYRQQEQHHRDAVKPNLDRVEYYRRYAEYCEEIVGRYERPLTASEKAKVDRSVQGPVKEAFFDYDNDDQPTGAIVNWYNGASTRYCFNTKAELDAFIDALKESE